MSRYLPAGRRPSPTWQTFLRNHVGSLASIDFCVVPTVTFRLLCVFVVLCHQRRRVVHVNVTAHPTAAFVAQQLREAFLLSATVPRAAQVALAAVPVMLYYPSRAFVLPTKTSPLRDAFPHRILTFRFTFPREINGEAPQSPNRPA